jgi:hypothetical protein
MNEETVLIALLCFAVGFLIRGELRGLKLKKAEKEA